MTRRAALPSARLAAPRAVLFDWDSTLVDNWLSIEHAVNATLAQMGHPVWTAEETRRRVRESVRDTFPRLFGERWPEARSIFYAAFVEKHLEHLKPLAGAAEMLAALGESGVYLGVVSNKQGALLRKEADHLGWTGSFRRLVGAGDAARDKPDAAPVALALQGSAIAPGRQVWMVGDTALDMRCAVNAGCVPVLLLGHASATDDFSAAPPELEVADWPSFSTLVRSL